jgi:predicted CoA-binding protein
MNSIISQVQALAENANEATRRDILDGLRNLASVGRTEKDMFTANNIIKYLSDPGVQSAVYHKYAFFTFIG